MGHRNLFVRFILVCALVVHAAVIKEGDVLDIQVQGNERFSGRFTVKDNGTVDYPLLPDMPVANLSTSELMNDLTFRLAKHIENPLVWITIIDKPEITVTVLGRIQKPGPVTTYLGVSIQEVIKLAGDVSEHADVERIKIIRKGRSDADAEYFDFNEFLRQGEYASLPTVMDGDVIILISEQRTKKVKVIGAVNKPGFFALEEKMNLFEMIYLAGGPAEKADLSRVRRFFKTDDKTLEEVINIQNYLDKGKMDEIPMVNEGDVIIIYARWFDWRMLLTILNNVLLFIVTVQTLRGALN
jgi:protein involved in polysaccharide export with SLBB domain